MGRAQRALAAAALAALPSVAQAQWSEPPFDDELAVDGGSDGQRRLLGRDLVAVSVASLTRWTAVGELRRQLREAGYGDLSPLSQQLAVSLRGGVHGVRLGFDIGGEVADRRVTRESDGSSLEVTEVFGSLDLGYELYSQEPLAVFPHVGFAFGTTSVTLPPPRSFGFDAPDERPTSDLYLNKNATAVRLGVTLEHATARPLAPVHGKDEVGGVLLSFGLGYLVPLHESPWMLSEQDEDGRSESLRGGPTVPLAGWYAHVGLGLAYFWGDFGPDPPPPRIR